MLIKKHLISDEKMVWKLFDKITNRDVHGNENIHSLNVSNEIYGIVFGISLSYIKMAANGLIGLSILLNEFVKKIIGLKLFLKWY